MIFSFQPRLLEGLAGDGVPGADGVDAAGGEGLGGFVGGDVDHGDVGVFEAVGFKGFYEEEVFDEVEFDADFFAFEVFDGVDAGFADDHVIAEGVVGEEDGGGGAAAGAGDHGIAVGDGDGVYVGKKRLASRRADWAKVAKGWFKTVAYINDPKTHDEAVKIMAARVQVDPKDYEKSLKGTFLLDLPDNVKCYKKGDGLDSVIGSSKVVDAFNVKAGVYKKAQDVESYFDASIVNDLADKK